MNKKETRCLNCNRVIEIKGSQNKIYCNDECSFLYRDSKFKKAVMEVTLELERRKWMKSKVGLIWKFFQIFGEDLSCSICGMTNNENIDEYGSPLNFKLHDGINNFKVLDVNSWQIYCQKCSIKINEIKEKSNIDG